MQCTPAGQAPLGSRQQWAPEEGLRWGGGHGCGAPMVVAQPQHRATLLCDLKRLASPVWLAGTVPPLCDGAAVGMWGCPPSPAAPRRPNHRADPRDGGPPVDDARAGPRQRGRRGQGRGRPRCACRAKVAGRWRGVGGLRHVSFCLSCGPMEWCISLVSVHQAIATWRS